VWLSVGGNDFMGALCNKSKIDTISIEYKAAAIKVLAEYPNAKLLITGYPVPMNTFVDYVGSAACNLDTTGSTNSGAANMLDMVKQTVASLRTDQVFGDRVDQNIDIDRTWTMFGGSDNAYSNNATYGAHADPIHMTAAGYSSFSGGRTCVTRWAAARPPPPKPVGHQAGAGPHRHPEVREVTQRHLEVRQRSQLQR